MFSGFAAFIAIFLKQQFFLGVCLVLLGRIVLTFACCTGKSKQYARGFLCHVRYYTILKSVSCKQSSVSRERESNPRPPSYRACTCHIEPRGGIEPPTYYLPSTRSTTEPSGRAIIKILSHPLAPHPSPCPLLGLLTTKTAPSSPLHLPPVV